VLVLDRDVTLLGRKGAALAALGEIVVVFFDDVSLVERSDGVKLGESTFSPFLLLLLLLSV